MSKGRKSSYPERPSRAQGHQAPGVALKKPSSEHISGKRQTWLQRDVAAPSGPRPKEATFAGLSYCTSGHTAPALKAFMVKYRGFKVPLHVWGKKGKTAEA